MKKILPVVFMAMIFSVASAQTSFHSFLDSIAKIPAVPDKVDFAEAYLIVMEESGLPFIEADTANFIYYGTADSVKIAGDFNGWSGSWKSTRIPDTDFFYYSRIFEQTARLDYKFILNANNWILDPRNPNQVSGGFGPNSELAMPGYIQPWAIEEYEGVEQGSIESLSLESSLIGRTYNVQVYLPPGYEEAGNFTYSTVYVHDGSEYVSLGSMANVLDNLLDSSKIEPLIVVLISPKNRNDEYAFDNRFNFAEFITKTVVPYIDANYKTYPHASNRLTMGASFGGNISAIISYNYPDVFGNSGWHSPALWPNEGETALLYSLGDKKDVKIYFNAGTYENLGVDWVEWVDVLTLKGYTIDWKQFHEGHSWGLWRATIDDILIYFFPPGTTPVGIEETESARAIFVYPNPTSSLATVKLTIDTPGIFWIDLYDQKGQLQSSSQEKQASTGDLHFELDLSRYTAGVYHYILRGSEKKHSGMVVVR